MVLSFVVFISTSFSADSHCDDCDKKTPLTTGATAALGSKKTCVRNWVYSLPSSQSATSPTSPTSPTFGQPDSAEEVVPLTMDIKPQTPKNIPDHIITRDITFNEKTESAPKELELRLFCHSTFQEPDPAKPLTLDQIKTRYFALNMGQSFCVAFMPYVYLDPEPDDKGISLLDGFGWLAKVRAFSKWWLNPWSWWNPSAYLIDENDLVEWDESNARLTIHVDPSKNISFLQSQLNQFLLVGWKSEFAPYIVPATRVRLEKVVHMLFEKVEKPALESAGFKDVTFGTRVNLIRKRLEYYVQGTK